MQFSIIISETLISSKLIFLFLTAETSTLHKFVQNEHNSLLMMLKTWIWNQIWYLQNAFNIVHFILLKCL